MSTTVNHQQALDIALEHHRVGRIAEAEAIYRQLHAIYPDNADLWQLLGVVAHHFGRYDEALQLVERALAVHPDSPAFLNNYGLLLTRLGRREEAVAAFQRVVRLAPDGADGFYNMGITLAEMGRAADAVAAYEAALRLQPRHPSARLNLGLALATAGRTADAERHYRQVLAEEPGNLPVALNLGNLLKELARLDESIEVYRTAVARAPDDAEAISNLGCALKDRGEIDEALECFRRSLALNPLRPEIHSNLVFTGYCHPQISPADLAAEAARWNALHAVPLRSARRPHENDRSLERPLRVGYVSPDLRDHVVGRTLLPCFEAHDRRRFELYCYSGASCDDHITARYRAGSTAWRATLHVTAEELAEQIRRDRIDILVDLSVHTAFNRLLTFARRPAPVQLSWLGYPGPTGLEKMDGWISDRFLSPPDEPQLPGFEPPLRLPHAWTCYLPPAHSPAVSPLPAATSGHVTFGSFNNFAKITPSVLALWARILEQVPHSRLLLVVKGSRQERTRQFFTERGIAADRVEFLSYSPGQPATTGVEPPPAYLLRYHRTDIALDPFPYNGMTTTCDALWMGVPVVGLIGRTTLGRATYSLLANLGHPELAAASEENYLQTAVALARDLPRLANLRASLRPAMERSPLLDARGFAAGLENIYLQAWKCWATGPKLPS